MIISYFKIAYRNLLKRKLFSFINLVGLSAGGASSFLVFLFIQDELRYDRYHEKAEQIYRLVTINTKSPEFGNTLTLIEDAGRLIVDLPGVIAGTRILPTNRLVCYRDRDKCFNEDRFCFADSTIFEIFTFPFIVGNPQTALTRPQTVVISKEIARKYFSNTNPVGEVFMVDDSLHFEVTGVFDDIPSNSHLKFDFLASISTILDPREAVLTYLLLEKNVSPKESEERVINLLKSYGPNYSFDAEIRPAFQSLKDIHFYSHLQGEVEPNGNIIYIYIFSLVAFLVLLVACINFINLSTTQAIQRAKEVGMRKVIGASRGQLLAQFFGEAIFSSFLAFSLAGVIVESVLPEFNALVNKNIERGRLENFLILFGIAIGVGIFSGSYPAIFLSRFQPTEVLKGRFIKVGGVYIFRKALVVAQFIISIILIVGTIVAYDQLRFVQNKKLGFNQEEVLVIIIRDKEVQRRYQIFKNDLLRYPHVRGVSASSTIPGRTGEKYLSHMLYRAPGQEEQLFVGTYIVDHDFLETYGIELAAGQNLSRAFFNDVEGVCILNEAAVKKFGWQSPDAAIDREIEYWHRKNNARGFKKSRVIGITKDFHFASLHSTIEPLIIRFLNPQDPVYPMMVHYSRTLSIRIRPEKIFETMTFIAAKWKEIDPNHPFEFFFLAESLDKLYQAEQRFARIFSYFSFLAILIASLGMFGLAAFAAIQRTKEIGIRKVLGASI